MRIQLRLYFLITGIISILSWNGAFAQNVDSLWQSSTFSELTFRSIGPAFMSGRIADIAMHPEDDNHWLVAVGSGGLWETKNAGVTWTPLFDGEAVYSTGCVTIDHSNPSVIWLGTGENVGGRHVSWGHGLYRSGDGGASWEHRGLKHSEHISQILIHPDNSDVLWVAAQGPLWSKGGQRGVYKSTDGGQEWTRVLGGDPWTGATEIVMDPRDPDVLYAATWDRHRTVAAYMGGGPGTGLYRSRDGGESWEKLSKGLPKSNMGKIGLAISPHDPDILYAAIELNQRTGAVYRSIDQGRSWTKMSDAVSGATGPHYYQELYACPHVKDRLYLMDVRMQISDDGGKTFRRMKESHKHSDNHAIAFRMDDPDYLLVGTDGGLYESFDLAQKWRFINNMPITQFYKLAVDDAEPFYNVYGGTQDNSTEGGPSRTDNYHGIQNSDWKIVLNWDGHQPACEPGNPDIMYGQRQEGTLSRIDLKTGEIIDIQPQSAADEPYERYNWDAPILISSHDPKRVYFASQRLWRSDNRGDKWTALSPDLTRNENRITLPIMGRQQSYDNAWDLYAMSNYNTITSIAESPLDQDILHIGTDDGLLQRSRDGGKTWTRSSVSEMPGVPDRAYVNDIKADLSDQGTVYIALDNHKQGDFKPYLLRSRDGGDTWRSITRGLPESTIVWRIVQDHINPDLLFVGTEFGVYFSRDAGDNWIQLKGGLPTIAIRDLTIQRREGDLVCASFGRSFYILDDIQPLRETTEEVLTGDGTLFGVRDAWWYIPRSHLGFYTDKGSMGASHFLAPNPDFGAVMTIYLGDQEPSMKAERQKREKKLNSQGVDVHFPGYESLLAEENELQDRYEIWISDVQGEIIRRVPVESKKGFQRVSWDLRLARATVRGQPLQLLAAPGEYSAELVKLSGSDMKSLGKKNFRVKAMRESSIPAPSMEEKIAFWQQYSELTKRHAAVLDEREEIKKELARIEKAMPLTPANVASLQKEIHEVKAFLQEVNILLSGNPKRNRIGEKPAIRPINERIFDLVRVISNSTYGPTPSAIAHIEIASQGLDECLEILEETEERVDSLEETIEQSGGPSVD